MAIRRLAALAAAVALALGVTPSAIAVADPNPTRGTNISDADLLAQMRTFGEVSDPEGPPQRYQNRRTDTASLYRQAGMTNAATSAPGPRTANTNSSGQLLPPGIRDHVDQYCAGTGTDGARVQVMYLRETDMPDRYAQVAPILRNEMRYIDDAFAVSSAQTGGGRRVRWVTDTNCNLNVLNVVLPDGAISGDFNTTETALSEAGFLKTNRKYLAFADVAGVTTGATCGEGRVLSDSSPTDNKNDGRFPQLARVVSECWVTGSNYNAVPLHELLHIMGAVQQDAPNATEGFHCTDMSEVMCYNDGFATPRQVCPTSNQYDIDCNNDDYFNLNPPAGSYLANHWNVANSPFLATVPALPNPPALAVSASTTSPLAGDPVTFTATVASGTTVKWSVDIAECKKNAEPTTGTTFTIQCFNPATPTVTATASNSGITVRDVATTITYGATSTFPTLDVSAPSSAQVGEAFALTATVRNSTATWSYAWTSNTSGCSGSPSGQAGATFNATCNSTVAGKTASFTVTATRAGDGARETTTLGVAIRTAGAPTNQIFGPSAVVAGQTGAFTVVTDATNASYEWVSQNGWGSGPNTTPNFKVLVPSSVQSGNDVVLLTVTNRDTNKSTTSSFVYDIEQAMTVTLSGPGRLVSGASSEYTVSSSKSAEYTWTVDEERCTLTPGSNPNTKRILACEDGFTGIAVLSVTASRIGEVVRATKSVTISSATAESTVISFGTAPGYPTRMRAVLSTVGGRTLDNQAVSLQRRDTNGSWVTVRTYKTGADGSVDDTYDVREATTFRFIFAGSGDFAASESASRTVVVTTALSHKKVRGGLLVQLATAYGQGIANAKVGLQSRVAGTKKWRAVNVYTTNSTGRVKVKVNPRKATQYRWKFAASSAYAASKSNAVRLR